MYRKVVEAHRGLRADFKASDDARFAAEQRADAAEKEVAALTADAPPTAIAVDSAELTKRREEAKHACRETAALWKAIADNVDASVLLSLRKTDTEARVSAEAETERQRRAALWDALRESVDAATFAAVAHNIPVQGGTAAQAALPVSVARRLFDACGGGASGEGTPREPGSGAGTPRGPRVSVGDQTGDQTIRCPRISNGGKSIQNQAQPPLPPVQKRLSCPGSFPELGCGAGASACDTPGRTRRESCGASVMEAQAPAMTPARTFPGGVITATPQSSSVRDRIKALESSGRKD